MIDFMKESMENDEELRKKMMDMVQDRLLESLEKVDFSKVLTEEIENLIHYLLYEDDNLYGEIQDYLAELIKNNIKISFNGRDNNENER
jgi:hypothetical protein